MWGICFDYTVCEGKVLPTELFQLVVEYEPSADGGTANITYPVKGILIAIDKIRQLEQPPRFVDGDLVSPVSHPELVGAIHEIRWHFNRQEYMYFITVNGKKKSKRYYFDDLIKR